MNFSGEPEYLVVIERADDGSFSAYVPDFPGCVSCGDTVDEVTDLIREAIRLHVESLTAHGEPVPQPAAVARMVRS
jgi:predicted RNase H-like HicB family nuclease